MSSRPRVEVTDDERDKKDREYVAMFDRDIMPQYEPAAPSQESKGMADAPWTWRTRSAKPYDLARHDLDAADAPEAATKRDHTGKIYGYNILMRNDWDAWRFDTGQMGPSNMEYGVFQRDMDLVRVDAAIHFEHLPGGPRTFKNKREAKSWLRTNLPDTGLNL